MSAAAEGQQHRPPIGPDASPRQIRAALLPEEVAAFDRAWRAVLAETAETLGLTGAFETLAHWRRIAASTQLDPEAHRRMLRQAEHALRTGEQPAGTMPWERLKAELGRRVAYQIDVYPDGQEQIRERVGQRFRSGPLQDRRR